MRSLLPGGGGKKEAEPRVCQTCAREKGLRASPQGPRIKTDGVTMAANEEDEPCGHKHVEFAPLVSAVYIPVHFEYR